MRKLLLLLFIFLVFTAYSQDKKIIYPVAFYNVENLFDTERDPVISDEDFTPFGKFKWDNDKYTKKLNNLAYVIALLGKDESPKGFALLGVAEVENGKVLEDLVNTGSLAKMGYKIVHKDSPDARGIDVGLIYDPSVFAVSSSKIYPFVLPGSNSIRTRDILLVSGLLAGEPVNVLVNHWPSRRGEASEPLRERAGAICKHICDSLYNINRNAGIIVMGDMNDDPADKSTRIALGAKRKQENVKPGELFNPMWEILDSGIGSLQYRGKWNLFDQIIVSQSLLGEGGSKLTYERAAVFNKDFLIQQSGAYKGYPLRTFSGTTFLNGYSDHLPTLIYLSKKK